MGHRPKTGERRQVRMPLRIDSFPEKVRNEIESRRAKGDTWQEISDASPEFAGKKLALSTLHRWYDIRVAQVNEDVRKRAEAARAIAESFAGKGIKRLPDAVKNALSAQIFELMQASDEKSRDKVRRGLLGLGVLLAEHRRLDIQQQRADAETKRIDELVRESEERRTKFDKATNDAAKKIGQGKGLTAKDIDSIRERVFGLPPVAASHPA